MSLSARIRTIYGKELVDILRDRRTLIAMIIVPIVLYPLLMLGSIQAVSYQADSLGEEVLVIGVVGERQQQLLAMLIERDHRALARERRRLGPDSPEAQALPVGIEKPRIVPFASEADLQESIRERSVHAGVNFERDALYLGLDESNPITIAADLEDMRSEYVASRLRDLFDRTAERSNKRRLRQQQLPEQFLYPLSVTLHNLSSPPSILGQILPLILILMTITGAIYPAIDLTAGERERGTLESLMVSPVPVLDLIVGKFLVVTTVAILGATLNLASVTATVYFGGFDRMIAQTSGDIPVGRMLLILVCLVPFAVLMSAIMIAVCSYARTFKEAQNYVTPVILAVLVPGGIAALPATRLEGVMLVMPVGNMVLLARDLLLGAAMSYWTVTLVLLSTTLYAGAAVAVAAYVFGKESVVFADAASIKVMFSRALARPTDAPSVPMALIFVALLFPTWFFIQSALSPGPGESAEYLLRTTGYLMPLLFVVLPAGVLWYWKVNVRETFRLHRPATRHLLAALIVGAAAWVPAHEVSVFQRGLMGLPAGAEESFELLGSTIAQMSPGSVFVLLALIPAICEELLFRGYLLGGLGAASRKWTAIVASAVVFAVFHFMLFKFAVTAALGVVLAYLCWQSGSILPAMVAHVVHNGLNALSPLYPAWPRALGLNPEDPWAHLPIPLVLAGCVALAAGVWLSARPVSRAARGAGHAASRN